MQTNDLNTTYDLFIVAKKIMYKGWSQRQHNEGDSCDICWRGNIYVICIFKTTVQWLKHDTYIYVAIKHNISYKNNEWFLTS
jgi:hypothetical protein